jgi:hypothetical protein
MRWRRRARTARRDLGLNPVNIVFSATGPSLARFVGSSQGGHNTDEPHTASCDGLHRTGDCSHRIPAADIVCPGARPSDVQRHLCCWRGWRLLERRAGTLGTAVSGRRDPVCISRSTVVPVSRRCVADALRLGLRPSLVGKSDLAVHADLLVRMHDL